MAKKGLLILLISLTFVGSVSARSSMGNSGELFSPVNSQLFQEIAYGLYTSGDAEVMDFETARVFLSSAMMLDPGADHLYEDILRLTYLIPEHFELGFFYGLIREYANGSADLEVVKKAIQAKLDQLNTRLERQVMLQKLLPMVNKDNNALTSEIHTQLALLATETANIKAATGHIQKAHSLDPYNKLAFEKMKEYLLRNDNTIEPSYHATQLRLELGANPLSLEAAFAFAQYTEELEMYEIAATAYAYTARTFEYFYPREALIPSIYLPWAIASYNTPWGYEKCLQIAKTIQKQGDFNLILEAIAGKAAAKLGNIEESKTILTSAAAKAEEHLADAKYTGPVTSEQLCWFYCFAMPDTQKSLAWANRAYSEDKDSPSIKAILAYTIAANTQMPMTERIAAAKELVVDLYEINQVAALVMGIVQLAEDQQEEALVSLKTSVMMDPGSLAAEKAKQLLDENDSQYISVAPSDTVMKALSAKFGGKLIPEFKPAGRILSAKLSITGSEFAYARSFDAKFVLTNESSDPLIISDIGLFRGNIRVDAEINGDITASIPALVVTKFRPSFPIGPDRHISVPLTLMTGSLKRILLTYPQADLEIEFTLYLDPVIAPDGTVRNSYRDIEPLKTTILRKGAHLTRKTLMQQLNAVAKGQIKQKIRAGQLFAGLLMEQAAIDKNKPLYKMAFIDRTVLVDAVRRSLVDDDWTVKIQTMASLLEFPMPLDFVLTDAVSKNLNDDRWPVRMMALYLLSKSQQKGFDNVLNWKAKYDGSLVIRDMAESLGAEIPEPKALPEAEPEAPLENVIEP